MFVMKTSMTNKELVLQFWAHMQANDFRAASTLFADSYVLDWPLSGERIRGKANFVTINERYPAHGRWHFTIHRCLAEGDQVVTDVTVTDGVVTAKAITFSTLSNGQIQRQVEYWPEPTAPAVWRAAYVERIGLEEQGSDNAEIDLATG